jgi:hypothetical protein
VVINAIAKEYFGYKWSQKTLSGADLEVTSLNPAFKNTNLLALLLAKQGRIYAVILNRTSSYCSNTGKEST